MAELMSRLLAFPPDKKKLSAKEYDTKIQEYQKDLAKLSEKDWNKQVEKKNILELLDPETNSIAYASALMHQIESNSKNQQKLEHLTGLVDVFLANFDPVQVRYMGDSWRSLFEWSAKVAESKSSGVVHLVYALLRLDPSVGTFTSSHLRLVQLALANDVPSQVLPILDKDIYAFPQRPVKNVPEDILSDDHELSNVFITEKSGFSAKLTSENVLQYYLLGAHIYIGRRNFNRARLFLEYIILSPCQAHTTSALQVEAYKKWLLIGLLSEGKSFPLPKTADQITIKNIRSLAKPYDALVESFEKRDYKKFQAEMQVAEGWWQQDGNVGLVTEAHNALMRYRVVDLQKTYAALPVSRVASLIEVPADNTSQLLADMISRGYLKASIAGSGADAVLRFHETSPSSAAVDDDLDLQTQRITALVAFIRDADTRLQLTKEYVEWLKRAKRSGGPDGDIADVMDLTWDPPMSQGNVDEDGDEDIMGP